MVFRSKIDLWLLVVLIVPTAMPLAQAVNALQTGANWVPHVLVFGLLCSGALWLLLSTRYTVQPDELLVRSGPFHWRIRRDGITRLTPSRSLLSSPALSLDRLQIDYDHGKRSILISPQDRSGFLQAMAGPAGAR